MRGKYSSVQITLHWLVFLLVIIVYCSMELRGFFPRSFRPVLSSLHYGSGILIMVLMFARLAGRAIWPTPPIEPKPSPMVTGLSHLAHLVLYLMFIALPILGIVYRYYSGTDWAIFGLPMPVAATPREDFAWQVKEIHELVATVGYYVIGLHAAAALAHHYFWKDNTLLRMMPRKKSS
ncbi:cytochrome b561 [Mangrovibacter phragmitis]|nr:cytochrome b561 [Mangrovibacter phragmitis]